MAIYKTTADGKFIACKMSIIGTQHRIYSVWEKYNGHSTLTFINGIKYGKLGTRQSENINIPVGNERSKLVDEFFNTQYELAYSIIQGLFFETNIDCCNNSNKYCMGEISLTEE